LIPFFQKSSDFSVTTVTAPLSPLSERFGNDGEVKISVTLASLEPVLPPAGGKYRHCSDSDFAHDDGKRKAQCHLLILYQTYSVAKVTLVAVKFETFIKNVSRVVRYECHFESVSEQEILAGHLKRITLTAEKSLAALAPLSLTRILNRS